MDVLDPATPDDMTLDLAPGKPRLEAGSPQPLGANWTGRGTNFAVFSAHVDDDFSRMVEAPVELRRSRTPAEVRAELHDTLAERQRALEGFGSEKFDEESWTPAGPGTYRDFMVIRLFDLWMHEQDVRHARDMPGHLSGPVVASVLANNAGKALPLVVGKRADAPIGAVVAIDVVGPTEASFVVQVNDVSGKKRARASAGR